MKIPPLEKFIKNPWAYRLVTLDPGETTGYSIWDSNEMSDCGQLPTHTVRGSIHGLSKWLDTVANRGKYNPIFVMEEYRVYAHKTDDHSQSTMHTSRLIGALECMLVLRDIPYVMQGAGMAKNFCTDEKLKAWGYWIKGERHARDAIRHGVYYLCHGKPPL